MAKMCFGFNGPPKKSLRGIQQCNQAVSEGGETLSYCCIPRILTYGAPSHAYTFRGVFIYSSAARCETGSTTPPPRLTDTQNPSSYSEDNELTIAPPDFPLRHPT